MGSRGAAGMNRGASDDHGGRPAATPSFYNDSGHPDRREGSRRLIRKKTINYCYICLNIWQIITFAKLQL